jgi:predicted  nucleic acid-binding Zn-ribbon protein
MGKKQIIPDEVVARSEYNEKLENQIKGLKQKISDVSKLQADLYQQHTHSHNNYIRQLDSLGQEVSKYTARFKTNGVAWDNILLSLEKVLATNKKLVELVNLKFEDKTN